MTRMRPFLVAAALATAVLSASPALARGRTCTVDLDEVMLIRKQVIDLVKNNVAVDPGKAAKLARKYGGALTGGETPEFDPEDLKGAFKLKGKPSAAAFPIR